MAIRTDDTTPHRLINVSVRLTYADMALVDRAAEGRGKQRTEWMRVVLLTQAAEELGVPVPDLERYNPRQSLRAKAKELGLKPRRLEEIGAAFLVTQLESGRVTARQIRASGDVDLFRTLFPGADETDPRTPPQQHPQQRTAKRVKR